MGFTSLMSCTRLAFGKRTRFELRAAPAQPPIQLLCDLDRSPLAQCAFPDDCYSPAGLEQLPSVASVPFSVRIELGSPELLASGRHGRVRAACVSVPEAAVNEAHCTESTKHEVWSSRESPVVQTVSEPTGMDGLAKNEFRPCVPASDPRHHARTGCAIHYVWHRCSCTAPEKHLRQQTTRDVSDVIQLDGMLRRGTEPVGSVSPHCGQAPTKDGAVGSAGSIGVISPFDCDP